jgi:hypothetical protein
MMNRQNQNSPMDRKGGPLPGQTPNPNDNQQQQSSGSIGQQSGFPHEEGGWGQDQQDDPTTRKDAVRERDLNHDDDQNDPAGKGM